MSNLLSLLPGRVTRSRLSCLLALTVVVSLLGSSQAFGLEGLRPKLSRVSKSVSAYLRGEGTSKVALGAVTGQAIFMSSKGPGIKRILVEEFANEGIGVVRNAAFEVTMDYRLTEDDDRSALEGVPIPQILLSVDIVNVRSGRRTCLEARIRDQVDVESETLADLVCELFAIDCDDRGAGMSIKQFAKWLDRKRDHLVTAAVSYKAQQADEPVPFEQEGPYRLEILTGRDDDRYEKKLLEDCGTLAYVNLKKNDEYAVKLINDSDNDAVVELSIDGLSAFLFSEDDLKYFLVPKHTSVLVEGWYRTQALCDAFLITKYSESAAYYLSSDSNQVGTITAKFAAAWESDEQRPADESGTAASPSAGTSRGKEKQHEFEAVQRYIGRTRKIMNIRYVKPPMPVRPTT